MRRYAANTSGARSGPTSAGSDRYSGGPSSVCGRPPSGSGIPSSANAASRDPRMPGAESMRVPSRSSRTVAGGRVEESPPPILPAGGPPRRARGGARRAPAACGRGRGRPKNVGARWGAAGGAGETGPGRVLSTRELNRAVLARQLLLERADASPGEVAARVCGLQTQHAPSGYIAMWSRAAGFRRADLTAALEQAEVVQGWVMRNTIHMVAA